MTGGASDGVSGVSAWVGGTLRMGGTHQGRRQELVNAGGGGQARDVGGVQDKGKHHGGYGGENRPWQLPCCIK